VSKPTVLIVDDDESFRGALERVLRSDYLVRAAGAFSEALRHLSPPPDVVVLDIRLDPDDLDNRDGLLLLKKLHEQFPHIPVLILTALGEIELAVECMRLGAVDFLQKRSDIRETRVRLQQALTRGRLSQRVQQLERDLSLVEPRQIVGSSPQMQEVRRWVDAVGREGDVTVLVRGETGTGKDLVARAIHAGGRRRDGPFTPVMLNALPASMVETELFGHEAGAFTDARERRLGYLEQSHGGVLFLDEVGELELNVQVKLLRVLQEREFQRLGSPQPIRLDIQVVAATNADLEARVHEGRFRQDLYYRLKVQEIVLPPLRERASDIPELVHHFLQVFRLQGKRVYQISSEAMRVLQSAPWPGNIRQLRNSVESGIFRAELNEHHCIEADDLPADLRLESKESAAESQRLQPGEEGFSVYEALARVELEYVQQALQATSGKKTEAWKLLGYNDRFTLYRRVRRILTQYPILKQEFPLLRVELHSGHEHQEPLS
jgi:DNA-binding NtrC family response regulator